MWSSTNKRIVKAVSHWHHLFEFDPHHLALSKGCCSFWFDNTDGDQRKCSILKWWIVIWAWGSPSSVAYTSCWAWISKRFIFESCIIYVFIFWQVFPECHLQYHEQEDLQLLPISLVSTLLIFLYMTISLVYLSFVFQGRIYGNMTLDLMYWFAIVNGHCVRSLHGCSILCSEFFSGAL